MVHKTMCLKCQIFITAHGNVAHIKRKVNGTKKEFNNTLKLN